MLISTLPVITDERAITKMFDHPLIGGVRYNVGTRSPYSPKETLERIQRHNEHGKKFWIDLKGRQLRITKWADPTYADIYVNHSFSVDLPATIIYRNGDTANIVDIKGNKIYVDPVPREALGDGQAINVIGNNLKIDGYLTDLDKKYIEAAKELGIKDFMLSFVECQEDLNSVMNLFETPIYMVLKIESIPGLNFVQNSNVGMWPNVQLMLARDDLMVNIGDDKAQILKATKIIHDQDPKAIAASHIFGSLIRGPVNAADFSDLAHLHSVGYKNFMFSDTVSHRHFDEAMKSWRQFQYWYQEFLSEPWTP